MAGTLKKDVGLPIIPARINWSPGKSVLCGIREIFDCLSPVSSPRSHPWRNLLHLWPRRDKNQTQGFLAGETNIASEKQQKKRLWSTTDCILHLCFENTLCTSLHMHHEHLTASWGCVEKWYQISFDGWYATPSGECNPSPIIMSTAHETHIFRNF